MAPDSPTNLSLNANHTLTWDVVLGAAKYKIERAEVGGYYAQVAEENPPTHSLTDVTFKTRNYRVKACNEDNLCSIPSNGILVDYKLSLDAEDSAVILNWGGSVPDVSRYDVYYASQSLAGVSNSLASNYTNIPGAVTVSSLSPTTTYNVTSLSNDTEYYFMVTATTTDSTVLVSAEESIIPPGYVDFSTAMNSYGGFYNPPNHPNGKAFAVLTADGSIKVWGRDGSGGNQADVPPGNGFVKIYTNYKAFAALKADGTIHVWGRNGSGGNQDNVPTGDGFVKIYSNNYAFSALKADGTIVSWGESIHCGSGAPTGNGFKKVYSTEHACAALKADGTIHVWGSDDFGGSGAPTGSGYSFK